LGETHPWRQFYQGISNPRAWNAGPEFFHQWLELGQEPAGRVTTRPKKYPQKKGVASSLLQEF